MGENENRPGFINLLGVEGLSTNVGRPMPVFGSDVEDAVVVLPEAKMTLGHFVVYPKRIAVGTSREEQEAWQAKRNTASRFYQEARVVGKISKNREPTHQVNQRQGSIRIPPVLAANSTVVDAQAAFYVASTEVQERFTYFSRETLFDLDPDLRKMATLVTIVDSPIQARPVAGDRDEDNSGFEVYADFRQFVTLGMPEAEIKEFTIYSEHGEYPIWIPKDVEMGMLLRMDKRVMVDPPDIKRNMTRQERQARLLNKLKGV